MGLSRKILFIVCALGILVSSCNSSHQASKKRRKQAPCDCPKFNYVPGHALPYYVCNESMINVTNA